MRPRRQGSVGNVPERATQSVACEGEVRHHQDGRGRKFGQDTKGGTVSVAHEGDTTKSGYLTFEPGGMPTINRRKTGGQISESSRSHRGNPS